ncbi:MAG TPA: Coagulation factor 5/8 type domain-containing protein, partial [Solirubrobacteraceae bacterium]|nr:Coagulation factor 5/8 type domain-containing protein [Solirubrobacteraceae bacterium]
MRRLPLLALALVLALPPATAAAQEDMARYELVHGCYQLHSNALGRQVAADAGPFRMQATRLGQYLLYGKAQDFLAAGSDDSVGPAGEPNGAADWKVEGTTGAFRLALPDADGKVLVAGDDGALRVVDPAQAGDDTLFSFLPAEGCAVYPEVELNATGTTQRHPTPFGEVRGTVDGHMHMMAFEFIGGSVHCGRPWHPYGAPYALVD